MLRVIFAASRLAVQNTIANSSLALQNVIKPSLISQIYRNNFSCLVSPSPLIQSAVKNATINLTPIRTVTKYSYQTGKRKSVKNVLKRFYRLNWGIWIRTYCGRHKKLWKKSPPRKRRLRQHVFCNASQSWKLDKMAGEYWRKPKYFVDDPYEPYHQRDEFPFATTKLRPYFPPEENLSKPM